MIRNSISGIVAGTLVLLNGALAFAAPAPTTTVKSSHLSSDSRQIAQGGINTAAVENSVFQQINSYRATQNLPQLTRNAAIDNQARIHSQNMANGKVPLGHTGFMQRIQATGIPYRAVAENVAYNRGTSDPATQAVKGWLKSSQHLSNIQGNYNLTGVGVAANSKGEVYFTQIFIRKA
jgi:uncharacterized protein YkwD